MTSVRVQVCKQTHTHPHTCESFEYLSEMKVNNRYRHQVENSFSKFYEHLNMNEGTHDRNTMKVERWKAYLLIYLYYSIVEHQNENKISI